MKSIRSFQFAFKGVYQFIKSENNARIHLLASVVVSIAGFYFQLSQSEWLWIVLVMALVWVTEVINTAIERLVDLVSPGFNVQAGAVKDLAAAAVLFAAIASVVVGALIFWPHLKSV